MKLVLKSEQLTHIFRSRELDDCAGHIDILVVILTKATLTLDLTGE